MTTAPWRDPALPAAARVDDLLARMTLEEKTAQLVRRVGGRRRTDGDGVAPHQHDMSADPPTTGRADHPRARPADPAVRHRARRPGARRPVAGPHPARRSPPPAASASRRVAHEECLAGFTAWRATAYPVPLAWGATFDPALVEEMAGAIGRDLRAVGVHQGLAPVLDVVRDPRWGRVEETIGEDPYLVGTVGTAYVRGLESAGLVATLKHFAGYSASRAGRNLAPGAGGRPGVRRRDRCRRSRWRCARAAPARSCTPTPRPTACPAAADPELLTGLLREEWGFTGTVVADYFGIGFLQTLHGVAGTPADAAGARPDGRRRRRAAHREVLRRAADRGRRARARSPRRWSTGRAAPGAAPEVRARPARRGLAGPRDRRGGRPATSAARPAGTGPPAGRGVGRPAAQPTACCRSPAGHPDRGGRPARRRPAGDARLLLLPQPRRRAPPRRPSWASRSRRCSRRCAPNSPTRKVTFTAGLRGRRRRTPSGFAEAVARGRARRTCAWPCSATGPGCSAGAPPARAATRPTCACPACRASCSTRCSPPAPRSCSCC